MKKPLVPDETWMDFVEEELDETFKQDLSALLMNSQSDKNNMNGIKTLRDLIKSTDDVLLPEDGRVYDNLHDKIMAATANMEPGTAIPESAGTISFIDRFTRKHFRTTVMMGTTALSALAIAVFTWIGTTQNIEVGPQAGAQVESSPMNEVAILSDGAHAQGSINDEVLAIAGEDEFVADAASQKIANMSDQDYADLLESLR
jgi:hypothetical protein